MTNYRGERFFFIMGLVMIALIIAGFVPRGLMQPGGVTATPLLLHIHGAIFLSWFILFAVQARLIGAGNLRLHKRLGQLSVLLAATMFVVAYFVIRDAYSRPDFSIAGMPTATSIIFPFTDMVNFAIAYGLALANRGTPAIHKRWMLLAGILMMDPAAARIAGNLSAPPPLILLIELALFVALIVYDVRTRRRPSWATMCGLGLFFAALASKFTVAHTPAWANFVDAVFG